jgi:hypothetical protein
LRLFNESIRDQRRLDQQRTLQQLRAEFECAAVERERRLRHLTQVCARAKTKRITRFLFFCFSFLLQGRVFCFCFMLERQQCVLCSCSLAFDFWSLNFWIIFAIDYFSHNHSPTLSLSHPPALSVSPFPPSLHQDEIERADADQAQRRQREEILAREERAEQVCVVFVWNHDRHTKIDT